MTISELADEGRRINLAARREGATARDAKAIAMQLKRKATKEKAKREAAKFRRRCADEGLPLPVQEYHFAKPRKWRFDFCWEAERVALEVEGGVWTYGRHNRGSGFIGDMEKYNAAILRGWRVVRCVPKDLNSEETLAMVKQLLQPLERAA